MKVCWNLTNICNEDCVFCFRDLVEPAISLEDNMNILNKLASLGVSSITYAGGEPLLYKGIKDLLSYSRYLGIKNNLITNGSLLNKDNLSEYLCNVDKLTFSTFLSSILNFSEIFLNTLSGEETETTFTLTNASFKSFREAATTSSFVKALTVSALP